MGGGFGAFLFEDKFHAWSFGVRVKQRTSLEGMKKIESSNDRTMTESAAAEDMDVAKLTTADELQKLASQTVFDAKTNTLEDVRSFLVVVKGKGFTFTRESAVTEVKEQIARALPGYLTGGGNVF